MNELECVYGDNEIDEDKKEDNELWMESMQQGKY